MAEGAWRLPAVRWRQALRLLGFDTPDCLPGEQYGPECGGTDAEHAVSYLGALLAVVEHHLEHVPPEAREVAESAHDAAAVELAALDAARPCGGGHASP
jgi:hypothetical protein